MQATTFFLVDQQPQSPQPQERGGPSLRGSNSRDMKGSWSSLLDSDTDSIISGSEYSPPLRARSGSRGAGPNERRSFESFINAATRDDIFRRRCLDDDLLDSDSSTSSGRPRVPPSLSNSTAFATALGSAGKAPTQKFIMPRVEMPTRRPFTSEGLAIGKLKVLVAGDSGAGKTSLIQALAGTSDHVVYVDDAPTPVPPHEPSGSLFDNLDERPEHQHALSELLASTRPVLAFQDPSQSRRGSTSSTNTSSDLAALDRNLCFVDTIGYGNFTSAVNCITPVIAYLQSTYDRTLDLVNPAAPDALGMLASTGVLTEGALVDVCLYCVVQRLKPVDVEYIRRLSEHVPVVPVITKADLGGDSGLALKAEILRKIGNDAFWFGRDHNELLGRLDAAVASSQTSSKDTIAPDNEDNSNSTDDDDAMLIPPAVSTVLAPTTEVLASVLMSSTYTPPLVNSELRAFTAYVISAEGAAWLRFTAAKKFLAWAARTQTESTIYAESRYLTPSGVLSAGPLVPIGNRALTCHRDTRAATTGLDLDDADAELVVNLPDHVLQQCTAQAETSRWVNSLSESALATRPEASSSFSTQQRQQRFQGASDTRPARTSHPGISKNTSSACTSSNAAWNRRRTLSRSRRGTLSSPPPHKHSLSITNIDPLGLHVALDWVVTWALRAAGLVLGVQLSIGMWSWWASGSGSEEGQEGLKVLGKLGGGWSVLL